MQRIVTGSRAILGASFLIAGGLLSAALLAERAGAAPPRLEISSTNRNPGSSVAYIKFDGVDGEAKDAAHDKWIDVLAIDWGANKPGGGATGQSRRRRRVQVDDMTLTLDLDKATPKLQEKLLKGEVIPKLEIDLAAEYGEDARRTYLRYELKNVQITSFQVSGGAAGEPPTVVVGNNFEEVKVTYTEYDSQGTSKGNVETTWKVEKGSK